MQGNNSAEMVDRLSGAMLMVFAQYILCNEKLLQDREGNEIMEESPVHRE